jgi:hypothetical protein
MEYKYDVTLSFAGEDREYVEKVATTLKQNGIEVFYDKFEEVDLWGKDLGVHFDYVYRKGSRYCVIFISENYKKKIWTNHEIKTAISRAIETNVEYILPARFDDTEIDGIRPTLGFIDLRKIEAENFAHLIIKKLEKEPSTPLPEKEQKDDKNESTYLGINVIGNTHSAFRAVGLGVTFTNLNKEHRYMNEPFFKLSIKMDEVGTDTFYLIEKLQNVNFPHKLEYGQVFSVTYLLQAGSIEMWKKLPPETTLQAIVTSSIGEKFKSNEASIGKIIQIYSEMGIR